MRVLENINQVYKESIIEKMIDVILSIEAIYNQNPQYGLDLLDLRITKRLKVSLSKYISDLELFNISLTIFNDFNSFAIREIPRIQIIFKPRYKAFFNENEETVVEENKIASDIVDRINRKILSMSKKHIDDVRSENLSIEDGFLLKINLESVSDVIDFKGICNYFIQEASELSLEEMFISQQLTTRYTIEKSKPYSLHKIKKDSPKMLYIQLINTRNLDSDFYIKAIFLHIISNFTNMAAEQRSISFRSINNAYVTINFY